MINDEVTGSKLSSLGELPESTEGTERWNTASYRSKMMWMDVCPFVPGTAGGKQYSIQYFPLGVCVCEWDREREKCGRRNGDRRSIALAAPKTDPSAGAPSLPCPTPSFQTSTLFFFFLTQDCASHSEQSALIVPHRFFYHSCSWESSRASSDLGVLTAQV